MVKVLFTLTTKLLNKSAASRFFKHQLLLSNSTKRMATLSGIDQGKKAAAYQAVDQHVKSNMTVGVGSGSTIVFAVERLAELTKCGALTNVKYVPTSHQARQLILENELCLTSLEVTCELDVAIDGADEADPDLTLIKGGGGCLAQEKVVAENAKEFVVIADDRKKTNHLGTSFAYIPIEVLPLAYKPLMQSVERRFGGKVALRMAKAKAGPVVTDNSNLLLDWTFNLNELKSKFAIEDDKSLWKRVNIQLLTMAGVVDTGLFVGMAKIAYFGNAQGQIEKSSI